MSFIDFAALKAAVTIDQAAHTLGLTLKQEGSQFRSACPACKSGGDRAIVLTPAKGLFYCFSAKKGGDCIGLAAHVMDVGNNDAANYLVDQLGTGDGTVPVKDTGTVSEERATAPKSKTEGRTAKAQPSSAPFDAQSYAAKLEYTEHVASLGISEEDAARLQVGFSSSGLMRGRVCFPIRNLDGSISGFIGWNGTDLKLPSKWQHGNVMPFKRPA